jgi:hypothetical protein
MLALINIPGFSLFGNHPALCGRLVAYMNDMYHRTYVNLASNQGQIIVAAHLYNAVQRCCPLSQGVQWADMDWRIERQGSEWIFVGKRPQRATEFGQKLRLARGTPVHTLTKTHNARKAGGPPRHIVGRIRRLEYHARYSVHMVDKEPRYKNPLGPSKCSGDILMMVETLVKDHVGTGATTGLSSIDKLNMFKLVIDKDEDAFNFDILDLYLRCIRLLQRIHAHALAHAPHDYPVPEFKPGLYMNTVIMELMYELGGAPRHNDSIWPTAVAMLRKVIEEEGDATLKKAEAIRAQAKDRPVSHAQADEPSFENPWEDMFDLEWRDMARIIIIQDENGDCRAPFGM